MFHKDIFVMFVLYLCQQGCHRQIDRQAFLVILSNTFLTVLRNISKNSKQNFLYFNRYILVIKLGQFIYLFIFWGEGGVLKS